MPHFECGAIDHSATSPAQQMTYVSLCVLARRFPIPPMMPTPCSGLRSGTATRREAGFEPVLQPLAIELAADQHELVARTMTA
jgi:hypothetical protein